MKKINLITVLIFVLFVGTISVTVYAVNDSVNQEEKQIVVADKTNKKIMDEEKTQQLQSLVEAGKSLVGRYWYQEKMLLGEISENDTRMTFEEVENIISSAQSFDEILENLDERQEYPDFSGGSGVTLIKYWLDDAGNDLITIIYEQGQIFHSYPSDGESVHDLIYSASQETE